MAPPDHPSEESLLTALGHPLRRRILRAMADGKPASPKGLAEALSEPLSNVSYHVRVLVQSGALKLVRTKPARGSIQHFYRSDVQAPWAQEVLALGDENSESAGQSQGGASA
ncbi:MAG TPA: helix-turn-helix domain-containing protein [Solirubrobacterales bacterium]|nr:helix-turn-helix domain-containing protein [Solirubrobacterales bacterium]